MAIDHVKLADELAELRSLALKKLAEEPLPQGSEANRRIRAEIRELGLEANIADLETQGYTLLGPGEAAPIEFTNRLRDAIVRVADQEEAALKEGTGSPGSGTGTLHGFLVARDRIFEEVLTQPKPLTLATYLLGYRLKLSQCAGLVKDATSEPLFFHADHTRKIPAPWPSVSQYCNVSWLLTEYTRENGALCVFPGSHKFCHDVPERLRMAHDHEDVKLIEAPAGSVIVWHGNLWHGAVPRTAPGKRVTLVLPHVRYAIQPQELFWASTTEEMIQRNPPRFASLMGLTAAWPWGYRSYDPAALAAGPTSSSPFE